MPVGTNLVALFSALAVSKKLTRLGLADASVHAGLFQVKGLVEGRLGGFLPLAVDLLARDYHLARHTCFCEANSEMK